MLLGVLAGAGRSGSPADVARQGAPPPFDVGYYRLALSIDTAARRLDGRVTVDLRVTAPELDSVRLDLSDSMRVDGVRLDRRPAGFTHRAGELAVAARAARGDRLELAVDYSGRPAGKGFAWVRHAGGPRISSYGLPYTARQWWPCRDVPADKADSADIELTVPAGLVAASNGRLVSRTTGADGSVTFHWAVRHPIYPDVVSLAIAPYDTFTLKHAEADGDTLPLRFYVFPEDAEKARAEFAVLPDMLSFYESVLGPYPFRDEKYGIAEFTTPSFREHQTLPSLGPNRITGTHEADGILAHDLAHQWFGNSLTVRSWSDIWLNESLAQYARLLWVEHSAGRGAYDRWFRRMEATDFPGPLYLRDSTDVEAMFTGVTFVKGPIVLHMLRGVMGDSAFLRALRRYVADFAYGTVSTRDFEREAEAAYGRPLGWFFDEWVFGSGRPMYAMTWSQRREADDYRLTVTIRQRQPGHPFRMPLPVRVESPAGSRTVTLEDSLPVQAFGLSLPDSVTAVTLDPGGQVYDGGEGAPVGAHGDGPGARP